MGSFDVARLTRASGEVHVAHGAVVLERCFLADTILRRTVGLLGTERLDAGTGLLIPGCRSVHTVGMRFAIGCVWLGPGGVVLRVDGWLRPGRFARCPRASAALEVLPEHAPTVGAGERLCGETARLRAGLGLNSSETCAICEESVPSTGERTPRLNPLLGDGRGGPDG